MAGKKNLGDMNAGEFQMVKSRTIRYNNDTQFIRVGIQKIQGKKIMTISRGYKNKQGNDIIKSTVTVSYTEIADKVAQQINELKNELPSIKKKITKSKKNKDSDKDIEIKL